MPKMLVSWIVVYLAALVAIFLGYKAKRSKRFGEIITIFIFTLYGALPFFLMRGIYESLIYMGIWSQGGDVDIGPTLTPLLMLPLYWFCAWIGMVMAKATLAKDDGGVE